MPAAQCWTCRGWTRTTLATSSVVMLRRSRVTLSAYIKPPGWLACAAVPPGTRSSLCDVMDFVLYVALYVVLYNTPTDVVNNLLNNVPDDIHGAK